MDDAKKKSQLREENNAKDMVFDLSRASLDITPVKDNIEQLPRVEKSSLD